MRFTVVDDEGTISFVGPAHLLKMLAAACSKHPCDHRALISMAADFDPDVSARLNQGLQALDNRGPAAANGAAASGVEPFGDDETRPFRVVDDASRRRSLEPARAGLVVFNLNARRIVQVQNSYADLHREGRGRIRRNGRPTRALYRYALPPEWSIVP